VSVDARKLVMGDWSGPVRDPLDVLRLLFGAGAVAFGAAGDVAGAFNLALAFGVLVAARFANLPRIYDLALIVALTFTQGGEALNLYDALAWYDRVVHVLVPMLSSQVLYLCLARIEVMPDPQQELLPHHRAGIFVAVFSLGLAVGALWEIFEWSSDGLFGSNLQEGNTDTVGDLIADATGSLAGGTLMVLWAQRGWGSVRRIPGENRGEETSA
jgi:hypothetical protein